VIVASLTPVQVIAVMVGSEVPSSVIVTSSDVGATWSTVEQRMASLKVRVTVLSLSSAVIESYVGAAPENAAVSSVS
jgi:hypothetical protein